MIQIPVVGQRDQEQAPAHGGDQQPPPGMNPNFQGLPPTATGSEDTGVQAVTLPQPQAAFDAASTGPQKPMVSLRRGPLPAPAAKLTERKSAPMRLVGDRDNSRRTCDVQPRRVRSEPKRDSVDPRGEAARELMRLQGLMNESSDESSGTTTPADGEYLSV